MNISDQFYMEIRPEANQLGALEGDQAEILAKVKKEDHFHKTIFPNAGII